MQKNNTGRKSRTPITPRLVAKNFPKVVPHAGDMGIETVSADKGEVTLRLPFRKEFLGDLDRQLVHTGVISSLMDTASGIAVLCRLTHMERIATLDLRVDYLRPALPDTDILIHAECYHLTQLIAFTQAVAWQKDESKPVAKGTAAFMLASNERRQSNEGRT